MSLKRGPKRPGEHCGQAALLRAMYARRGEWIAAADLAQASGLARKSVGSVMASCRGQGHAIESRNGAQGGGYRLMQKGQHP
jgi:biotin operon repressor